jgi:hypothetical protein
MELRGAHDNQINGPQQALFDRIQNISLRAVSKPDDCNAERLSRRTETGSEIAPMPAAGLA